MDPKQINFQPKIQDPKAKIQEPKQGRLAYWITVHKIQLRRGGILALSFIAGALLIYGLVGLINYYGFELPQAKREALELARPSIPPEAYERARPKPLQVKVVQVIPSPKGTVDALAYVTNENARIVSEFTYAFTSGGVSTEPERSFLLPGETRPLVGIAIEGGRSGNVSLAITDLHWKRLRPQEIQDPAAYQTARLGFRMVSQDYQAALPIDSTQIGRLTAQVANDTAFGYWKARFVIVLSRAGRFVGVSRAAIDRFGAGEERTLEATWIPSPGAADKIEIIPEVNVYDPGVFLPPPS